MSREEGRIELIAFEIIDFNRMKKEFLIELVKHANRRI